MLTTIRQLSNPVLRALAAACMAIAVVTIPATAGVWLFGFKGESAYQLVVYAAVILGVLAALIGLLVGKNPETANSAVLLKNTALEWNTWRQFVVDRKIKEGSNISSFYLRPVDGGSIPQFAPGQFLTIQLAVPNQSKPIIRTYSLSDYTVDTTYYRLSIKREPAPPESGAPPGVSSNFMHDHIEVGSVILAKPPSGRFVLDATNPLPAVLISNGVGITPMISMAKAAALLNPARHVWFLHGAQSGSLHAFQGEIAALAKVAPNLHVIYCYSRPSPADAGAYQHKGYVDAALISAVVAPEMHKLCGRTAAQYFLCGSPAFMESLRDGLRQSGVLDEQVAFESFAKAPAKAVYGSAAAVGGAAPAVEVVFSRSAKTLTWSPSDGTLLEFAEANGLSPDYGCRAGVCGTCMCALEAGAVEYDAEPAAAVAAGAVLICISRPTGARVVLDV